MDVNSELILIRITGVDRPGLTASFTEILSGYDVTIKGLTATNIEVLGKETRGNDEIVKFHAELQPGHVEWKAQDYYVNKF